MLTIRRAHSAEANTLNDIFYQSKAYWGYDETFMEWVRKTYCITAERITNSHVYVLETTSGQIVGYYDLLVTDHNLHLEDLFILPEVIGKGCGRLLFEHAVALARELGYAEFTLESDPNAESFYLKMGAQRVGLLESTIPGRFLPQMVYRLSS
jgi:GNAT superfamily N-acetyltransferase